MSSKPHFSQRNGGISGLQSLFSDSMQPIFAIPLNLNTEIFPNLSLQFYLSAKPRRFSHSSSINLVHSASQMRLPHGHVLRSRAVSVVGAEVLKRLLTLFTNLRHLQLSTLMTEAHVQAIMYILQNCYNINTLVIKMISAEETLVNIAECWGEEFLLKSLEHIEVQYIEGSPDELEFLKVLLKIAVTLRKMTIFASKRLSANNENRLDVFSDAILACERSSSNVEIVIRKS